ncbi:hypothetical protein HJ131_05130 [Vibrio parahaemolyticus]|nr:hypothetical protein AOR10_19530 [Vibrio alginolyticus]MBE3991839.1 hypothetical protein [Vibrio parahaemolyticus]
MINYIKQKRKRMAKVQKRTYAVIPQSKRTAIYKHLKADLCSDKILSHLDAGFEKSLFLASLRNLSDHGNPLRLNNFAYCMREVIGLILSKYSSDEDIKRCRWFVQDPNTDVTRVQRVVYAICGGMSPEYVRETILEVEEEEDDLLAETLKSFSKKFNALSKYTHVRSDKYFNASEKDCEEQSKNILVLTSDILTLIEDCRNEILWKIEEHLNKAVINASIERTMEGLDILSSHGMVNYLELEDYSVEKITSQSIEINGGGTAYCTLEWGSRSDWRNGDGASLDTDFPFNFKAFAAIANFEDIDIPENHIDIDNRSWYE